MAAVACPLCFNESFPHSNLLVTAFLNFLQRPLSCPLCAFEARNAGELGDHLVTHLIVAREEVPQYPCKQCNGSFSARDFATLKMHVESEHPERKYLCDHCFKPFKVQASLTLHLRMAHGSRASKVEVQQCQHCDKQFASPAKRQAHEKSHQLAEQQPNSPVELMDEQPGPNRTLLSCPVCDKTFKKEQYLQQHIRTHEAKKYECSVCRKLFTTKEYLRKHARLHTGETPYACDQCGKTFTFQQSYHKHLLYHSDERPYSCDQCNRRFKELSTLHNHQRIHTGEKPYSCDICGKAFRQRVSYVVHRRIHTGVLPYVCPACGKSFRYKVSQRTHKCEANQADDGETAAVDEGDVVRNRPGWLERLMTAQQQLTNQVHVDPGPIITVDSEPTPGPSSSSHQEEPFDPIKSYYDSDSLPTLDLSQLTLSLDSELIFPG